MKRGALFLIVVILFCGCTNKASTLVPVNSSLIKYFSYKPGTYWVYKDSIGGEVDSFYVISTTTSYPLNVNEQEMEVDITIMQKGIDSALWVWRMLYNGVGFSSEDANRSYNPLFGYPLSTSTSQFLTLSGSFDKAYCLNVYPSYTVGGQTFYGVEENHYISTSLGYNDWMYIDTAQGIVKMRWSDTSNTNNKVWELQRWNIVR